MNGDILDPDGARERVAAWKGRIDKLAADTQAMSDRLQQVRVTKSDPAGLAEVTVDSTGALVGLRLTERIQRTAPDTVAQAVMSLLQQARGQVASQSQEVIAETMGPDSAAGRAIAEQVGRHLRGTPTPPADDDDGDFDMQSHLRRR
jgi:DNA-binding protein YbaB